MGYSTEFFGELKTNKKLTPSIIKKIKKLNDYQPFEEMNDIFPESYCQWIVSEDKSSIIWDGNEKFSYYIEWLEYIVNNLLKPNKISLNGILYAEGEEKGDISKITVIKNIIEHHALNKDEKKEYRNEKKKHALKAAGKPIIGSHGEIEIIGNNSFMKLHDFLRGKAIRPRGVDRHFFVLVQEIDKKINLYKLDERYKVTALDKIKPTTLISELRYNLPKSITFADEILHFSSPIFKWLLKSSNVYCIGYKNLKYLVDVDNPEIFEMIKNYKDNLKEGFLFHKSNDKYILYYLLTKLFWTIITIFATFSMLYWSYSFSMDLINEFTIKSILSLVIMPIAYYYFIQQMYWGVYHVSLNMVFKTKTSSNKID